MRSIPIKTYASRTLGGYITYEDKMNPTAEEKAAHAQACSLLAVVGGLAGATMRVRGGGATAQPSSDDPRSAWE